MEATTKRRTADHRHAPAFTVFRWELLVLCWLAFFLNQADRQAFNVLIPLLKSDLSISDTQVGWISGLFSLSFALCLPLAGYAGDHWSRKRVILLSLTVWSAATMMTSLTTGFLSLVFLRSLATGGGEAFYFPSANSLLGQAYAKRRALAMAIHQSALYVGLVASGLVAGWCGRNIGWRATFIVFGVPGIVLALVWSLRVSDQTTPPPPHHEASRGGVAALSAWREALSTRTAQALAVAFVCMVFVNVGYLTWLPTYLHDRFSLSLARAGFDAMFWHHGAALVGVLAGGALSDRLAAVRPAARLEMAGAAFLVGAPFIWLLGSGSGQAVIYAGLAGFGLCRGLYEANMWAALFDVVPEHIRSQATGALVCLAYLVGTFSPVLLGSAKQSGAIAPALSSLAFVYLAAAAAIWLARFSFFDRERI